MDCPEASLDRASPRHAFVGGSVMNGKLWFTGVVAIGSLLGFSGGGFAQGPGPLAPGPDLDRLSRRMAESVHDLADDLGAGPGRNPAGQYLEPDARELQAATGNWYNTVRSTNDPYQLRRSYSGIDIAWHRLQSQIVGSGFADPAVSEELRRVADVDAQIHQALGLNNYPAIGNNVGNPNFAPGAAPFAPAIPDETRRLAYAVAQRGEALAGAVRNESGVNPALGARVAEADQLAQAVDAFYDSLSNPAVAGQPDYARSSYVAIVRQANTLGIALDATGMTPGLRPVWDSFASAHVLLRNNLNLAYPTADGLPGMAGVIPQTGYIVPPVPSAAVVGWAGELDRQVDELLANFAPTVNVVPEGRFMLDDMARLRQAAIVFKQEAAQGADPARLAFVFQDVDAHWQRLARRFDRIARGRTGPNIQRVQQIGQTCEQVHRALGMPGFPPTLGPY